MTATTQNTTAQSTQPASQITSTLIKVLKTTATFAAGATVGAGAYYLFQRFVSKAAEVVVESVVG